MLGVGAKMNASTVTTASQEQQAGEQYHWQLEDYALFRKCGEVTASPDKQCFALNCHFCPGICLQFDVFVQHVREQHAQDIRLLYANATSSAAEQQEPTTPNETRSIMDVGVDKVNNTSVDWHLALTVDKEATTATELRQKEAMASGAHTPLMGVEIELDLEMQSHAGREEEDDLVYIVERALLEGEMVELDNDGGGGGGGGGDKEPQSSADPFEMAGNNGDDVNWCDVSSASDSKKGTKNRLDDQNKSNTTTKVGVTKGKSPKSPRLREVEQNREIVAYLIDAYKSNEKLWNPTHPQYKYNANRKIFNALSEPLYRDMNCVLSGTEIFGIITELRCRYRRDLTKSKQYKGKYKSRLWYFERMEFLRTIIESKRAERAAKNRSEHETVASPPSNAEQSRTVQTREILSFLLQAFKSYEMLWNPLHPNYQVFNKKELFHDISIQLRDELNVVQSGEQCSHEIQKLRTRYRKELRILNKRKGLHIPKLWCFEQMDFLRRIDEEQILKRMNKRKGIIESRPTTKFLKAEPLTFASVEDNLRFIAIYRSYPALWDVDHVDYRSATYRSNALNQMLEKLNVSFGSKLSFDCLQKTIFQLRKDYAAAKQKILSQSCKPDASPDAIYAKLSEFLDTNLGPFRCETCKVVIKTSDQYKMHLSGHDNSRPFVCSLCGKGFQIPGNLTIHIRRHKRDFPYGCMVCQKRFATTSEVTIHMRSHTGERPYICDLCGKSFKTWSFFDIHRRTHLNQSPFHCPICDKGFYEKNRFTDHMNGHLNIRKHSCSECGKSFTTYANLRKHNELHLPVKKYKCTVCGKRFAQFASLRWHKRKTHTLEQYDQGQIEQ